MVCGCSLSSSLPNCCRIGALQLGQVAVGLFLGAAQLHQQVVGALFAERLHQQAAGIIQAAMDHEVLGLEQLPEFLQNVRRELGVMPRRSASSSVRRCTSASGNARRISSRQLLAHRHQQNGGLARATQLRRSALSRFPALYFLLCHDPSSSAFSSLVVRLFLPAVAGSPLPASIGMNPALQQTRTLRRFAFQMAGDLFQDLLRPGALRIDRRRFGRIQRRFLRRCPNSRGASGRQVFGRRRRCAAARDELRTPAPPESRAAAPRI